MLSKDAEERLAESLRTCGLRVTPQRLAILSFLEGNTEHPTAEVIYEGVRRQHPTMSMNTVYNTLEVFEEKGLVWRFGVRHGVASHYDPNTRVHPHVACVACGRVYDLDTESDCLREMRATAEAVGHDVVRVEINVLARCPDCR